MIPSFHYKTDNIELIFVLIQGQAQKNKTCPSIREQRTRSEEASGTRDSRRNMSLSPFKEEGLLHKAHNPAVQPSTQVTEQHPPAQSKNHLLLRLGDRMWKSPVRTREHPEAVAWWIFTTTRGESSSEGPNHCTFSSPRRHTGNFQPNYSVAKRWDRDPLAK